MVVRTHVRLPPAAGASLTRPTDSPDPKSITPAPTSSSLRTVRWASGRWTVVLDGAHDRTGHASSPRDLLADASSRVVRTVDGFHGDDWSDPSLLPRWTRAHVVAHLALNAEGMARALHGVVADDAVDGPQPMYDSDEKRDGDIIALATAHPAELRDRLLAGTTMLDQAIAAIPDDLWETRIERTPGGREIRAAAFPGMRLRELEIHHVDLGAGYTTSDWSEAFAIHLLNAMTKRLDPTPAVRGAAARHRPRVELRPDRRRRRGRDRPGRRHRLVAHRTPDSRHRVLLARRAPVHRRLVTRDRSSRAERLHRRGLPGRRGAAAYRGRPLRSPSSPSTRRCPTTAISCAAPTPATRC